jgi:hypothetical protein
MMWRDGRNWVALSRGDAVVAEMSLDDWSGLSATEYLLTDAVHQTASEQRQEAAG